MHNPKLFNKQFWSLWHSVNFLYPNLFIKDQLLNQLISQMLTKSYLHGLVFIVRTLTQTHIILPFLYLKKSKRNWPKHKSIIHANQPIFSLLMRIFLPLSQTYTFFHFINLSQVGLEPELLLNWLTNEYCAKKIPLVRSVYKLHNYLLKLSQSNSDWLLNRKKWLLVPFQTLLENLTQVNTYYKYSSSSVSEKSYHQIIKVDLPSIQKTISSVPPLSSSSLPLFYTPSYKSKFVKLFSNKNQLTPLLSKWKLHNIHLSFLMSHLPFFHQTHLDSLIFITFISSLSQYSIRSYAFRGYSISLKGTFQRGRSSQLKIVHGTLKWINKSSKKQIITQYGCVNAVMKI